MGDLPLLQIVPFKGFQRDYLLVTFKLNLPLILDFALILTPWFELCYFIFGKCVVNEGPVHS